MEEYRARPLQGVEPPLCMYEEELYTLPLDPEQRVEHIQAQVCTWTLPVLLPVVEDLERIAPVPEPLLKPPRAPISTMAVPGVS
jgi:hypothetical protein